MKKISTWLGILALAGFGYYFLVNAVDKSVSFTVCSGSVDMFDNGSRTMNVDTSAGSFIVTDPRVIAELGGDTPEPGRKFDGQYRGDDVQAVLTDVSPAIHPEEVLSCRQARS